MQKGLITQKKMNHHMPEKNKRALKEHLLIKWKKVIKVLLISCIKKHKNNLAIMKLINNLKIVISLLKNMIL